MRKKKNLLKKNPKIKVVVVVVVREIKNKKIKKIKKGFLFINF
jgi:hypothetical protein